MKKALWVIIYFSSLQLNAEEYEFCGTHYVASFMDCNHEALCDFYELENAMIKGIQKSGATLLNICKHTFPPNSITLVFLLSESHASIHTYPEYNSCFIDLFTCGNTCDYITFEQYLKNYLKPKKINNQIMRRK